jgi:hypothetical protein
MTQPPTTHRTGKTRRAIGERGALARISNLSNIHLSDNSVVQRWSRTWKQGVVVNIQRYPSGPRCRAEVNDILGWIKRDEI